MSTESAVENIGNGFSKLFLFIYLFHFLRLGPSVVRFINYQSVASRTDRLGPWNIDLEILQEPKSKNKLKLGDLKYLETLWRLILICIFDGWRIKFRPFDWGLTVNPFESHPTSLQNVGAVSSEVWTICHSCLFQQLLLQLFSLLL